MIERVDLRWLLQWLVHELMWMTFRGEQRSIFRIYKPWSKSATCSTRGKTLISWLTYWDGILTHIDCWRIKKAPRLERTVYFITQYLIYRLNLCTSKDCVCWIPCDEFVDLVYSIQSSCQPHWQQSCRHSVSLYLYLTPQHLELVTHADANLLYESAASCWHKNYQSKLTW